MGSILVFHSQCSGPTSSWITSSKPTLIPLTMKAGSPIPLERQGIPLSAPTRAAFFEYLANGFYTRCSPDFYNLIGRKPTSYADYLANKGAAGETGLEELYQSNMWKKGEDAMKAAVAAVSKH